MTVLSEDIRTYEESELDDYSINGGKGGPQKYSPSYGVLKSITRILCVSVLYYHM